MFDLLIAHLEHKCRTDTPTLRISYKQLDLDFSHTLVTLHLWEYYRKINLWVLKNYELSPLDNRLRCRFCCWLLCPFSQRLCLHLSIIFQPPPNQYYKFPFLENYFYNRCIFFFDSVPIHLGLYFVSLILIFYDLALMNVENVYWSLLQPFVRHWWVAIEFFGS